MRRPLACLSVGLAMLGATGCTLNRPEDPVVLTGAEVSKLRDVGAGDVVAFRWVNGWDQVPVQVDERKSVDLHTVYNGEPWGYSTTVYADPNTFTGADPDSDVDADDELAFMAKDVGIEAPADAGIPAGVVPGSGVKVEVRNWLGGTLRKGWAYLFERSGNLDPGAGESYVDYDFNLLSGDYKTTYGLGPGGGPNPEDSVVSTPYYEDHFSDRWLNDRLRVKAGTASEADILDRAKALLVPGECFQNEDTFDNDQGAFIVNKSGPVRAIRSYLGANSGPLTQREHVFYEQREDIRTFLRVHNITGVLDLFDYSNAAIGMTYRNNLNTGGVTIDGNPDSPAAGELTWETVDGSQGGLSIVHRIVSDIPELAPTSYYLDDSTPSVTQCTGDGAAIGTSGPWIDKPIPNTDPNATVDVSTLRSTRTIYFEAPGQANGPAREQQAKNPLGFIVSSYP